ncbi:MAG: efflux RND transporter periplasmic adaptor subunit [Anaerovoracaceae bacterium]
MGKIKEFIKRKKFLIIFLAIVIVAAVVIFGKLAGGNGGPEYMEAQAEVTEMGDSMSYDGFISAGTSQEVFAQNVSKIEKIHVKVGEYVNAGDVLVTYDEGNSGDTLASAQASIETANISLKAAQANLDRMEALYAVGGISDEEYEKAKDELATARAQVKQANASYNSAADSVSDLVVRAEVSGTVVSVDAKEGQDIVSGTKILEIASYDDLEVSITIDEYDKKMLQEGMKAKIKINSTEQEIDGVLTEIAKKADVENGVAYFKGKIKLNSSEDVSIGVSVEAKILTTEPKMALTVPVSAVQTREDGSTFVYGSDMQEIDVEVGQSSRNVTEIVKGLKEGDTVMVPMRDDDWERIQNGELDD